MAVLTMGEFPLFRMSHHNDDDCTCTPSKGTIRYFAVQRALPLGLFPAARLSVFLHGVSLAALVGIVFGILLAVH
jgi:hypothetical protein